MKFTAAASLCLATLAAAGPISKRQQDKSGNAQVYFECSSATFPNPGGAHGEGEGGTGISSSALQLNLPDGTVLHPQKGDCVQDKDVGVASYLQKCTLSHPSLEAGHLIVHVYYEDIAGQCSMNFGYRGQSYRVETAYGKDTTPTCGSSNGGFMPFSSKLSDVCYFNV